MLIGSCTAMGMQCAAEGISCKGDAFSSTSFPLLVVLPADQLENCISIIKHRSLLFRGLRACEKRCVLRSNTDTIYAGWILRDDVGKYLRLGNTRIDVIYTR